MGYTAELARAPEMDCASICAVFAATRRHQLYHHRRCIRAAVLGHTARDLSADLHPSLRSPSAPTTCDDRTADAVCVDTSRHHDGAGTAAPLVSGSDLASRLLVHSRHGLPWRTRAAASIFGATDRFLLLLVHRRRSGWIIQCAAGAGNFFGC